MADVVNATHKERLSQRDSEPSHLAGAVSYTDIGGNQGVDAEPNTAKVDGAKGVSTDTSIPKSVPAEGSHLGRVTGSEAASEADDVEVDFDGEEQGTDDLDSELDSFEDVEPVDVDVEVDDDDKKDVKESRARRGRNLRESDEDPEDPGAGERGDSESAVNANEKKPKSDMDSGPNDVKEEFPWQKDKDEDGDDDKEKVEEEFPFQKDDDDDKEKVDEDADNFGGDDNPDAPKKNATEPNSVMNKSGDGTVAEKFVLKLNMPKSRNLFESAGVPKADQKRIKLVFESAVKEVANQASKQLHKHYRVLHEQKLAKRDALLAKQIDGYLNYVVEEWVKTNKVAIRSSLRSQLAEEFMSGLQRLFTENYIDVPQSKVDVVKQLTKQVQALKTSLNEQTQAKMKLRNLAERANKARHIAEFVTEQKLSEAQAGKLKKLAENTQYVNAADFKEKLGMLSESYFPKPGKKDMKVAGTEGGKRLVEEAVQDEKKAEKPSTADPVVKAAMEASSRLADPNAW